MKIGGQATYSALHLLALALAEESGMPISYVLSVAISYSVATYYLFGHVLMVQLK